jgi:O-antigen ligase
MGKLKAALTDTSLFRRSYIICLFLCNVSPLLVVMYVLLAVLFLWGVFLLVYNEVVRQTAAKTRFGLWLVLFLVCGVITALIHLSGDPLYNLHNLIMLLHAGICFFIFYSVHTERQLNFRRELYSVCSFIVYTTTVLGIAGLACLMADIKFEIFGLKFIVFENRFTGLYCNPNTVGFTAVAAIFCCHMLLKKDFIAISGRERVSTIWIASGAAVNAISLLLSDSNGAMVLMIGYVFFFLVYKMFGTERKFSVRQIVTKSISCLLAGVVIVASLFFVRNVMQEGFVKLMSMSETEPIVVIQGDLTNDEDGIITFEHENKNIDSGRFKLWEQAGEMFIHNPIMGIGKGNIYAYGKQMFVNGVKFSDKYGLLSPLMTDFHNGYFTILVCSGAVGFVLFMIFGIRFFIHISKYVFKEEGLRESTLPCMYAFLCAYMVYAFVEEALLFNLSFVVVFFWLILGYASCFLVQFEPDRPEESVKLLKWNIRKTLL